MDQLQDPSKSLNEPASGTDLDRFIDQLAQPSIEADGGERDSHAVMIVSRMGDPIATERNWSNDMGKDRLTILYRIQLRRSASDILEYPNSKKPKTPLGRAWKQFKNQKSVQKAFEPITFIYMEK